MTMEASGTSGMKAAMNGCVNFSILDGWWPESYNGSNGWVIGGEDFDNESQQDNYDVNSLYDVLEKEIRPLFYRQDVDGIPEEWLKVVRSSMKTSIPHFSASRMLKDYVKAYLV